MLNWIKNYFRKPKAGEVWMGKYIKIITHITRVTDSGVWHVRNDLGYVTETSMKEFKGLYDKLD